MTLKIYNKKIIIILKGDLYMKERKARKTALGYVLIIDLIVVHELSHIIHPNHSKEFYDLIKEYICDYDKKDK